MRHDDGFQQIDAIRQALVELQASFEQRAIPCFGLPATSAVIGSLGDSCFETHDTIFGSEQGTHSLAVAYETHSLEYRHSAESPASSLLIETSNAPSIGRVGLEKLLQNIAGGSQLRQAIASSRTFLVDGRRARADGLSASGNSVWRLTEPSNPEITITIVEKAWAHDATTIIRVADLAPYFDEWEIRLLRP